MSRVYQMDSSNPFKTSSKLSNMSSLPPDIITSILIRLPVKSLLRFRSVSKSWCAEIDGPDFIRLHLTHSIITGSNHFPITEKGGTLYSLDANSLENIVILDGPDFVNPHRPILLSVCNGLLLMRPLPGPNDGYQRNPLFLFNPSTKKHLFLPPPPPNNKYTNLNPYGQSNYLGYDVINDDYKVFNILVLVDQDKKFVTSEARIYSLKSDSWHFVKDFTNGMIFDCDLVFGVYVNGALHTINDEDCTTIVALDVSKETFNLIHMPDMGDKNVSDIAPHVFDGCLAILCQYPDERTDIWVMKEYGVKESWIMFFSVKPENSDILVMPVIYSKSRTEVLLSYNRHELVWYDVKKRIFRGFEVSGLPIGFGQVYVESLVSVGGTGKLDEKKKQHIDEK